MLILLEKLRVSEQRRALVCVFKRRLIHLLEKNLLKNNSTIEQMP